MPRLIFVNRYFFPDHSATSQILSDLVFDLAGAGRDVHVVTSTQIYDDPKASLPEHEVIRGATVHRVPSTQFGRGALAGRALDYLSFYRSVRRRLMTLAQAGDLIVAKTDPPLTSVVALGAAKRTGARLINWLQDIYPETAAELGVPLMRGPLAAPLVAMRDRSLRAAVATVTVGEPMGRKVETLGVARARIHVIPNWCDDEDIVPIAASANTLRSDWGLGDKFVFGYSGNLGRAHEFETALAAAERLRDDPRFVFLMIGGGRRLEELRSIVAERRLDAGFRFIPYQERSLLRYSLGVPDAHWLSLNPKLEGLIVPSKFYGIAAAGRPIVAIADLNGELAQLVRQFRCGFAIAPGDADALVGALRDMAARPDLVADMGTRARQMLDAQFTRRHGLMRWRALLDGLLDDPAAPISPPAR
jgi:glycosyltransferase involved in cell wall biosynthesis